MRQVIKPNEEIDVATPHEVAQLLAPKEISKRVRLNAAIQLDGSGNGNADIFEVPSAMLFEVRRVSLLMAGNIPTDPVTGAVALNVAGHWVAYLRSGSIVEYAQTTYGANIQVPGAQTWSREQGPHFQNKEVFQVQAKGLTASVTLSVYAEGILTGPRST